MQSPPQPGDSPQAGGPASPWEAQQFSQQQAAPSANWPNTAQPTKPTGFKQSRLWLAIILVLLALIVIGGGTFVLFSHNGNNAATTSATQGTPTTNGVTPITTQSTGKTPTASLNSVGTPVQAGTDWVVTVTSAKSTSSSLIPPNAGSTYLEINLTLKNVSGKSLTLVSVLQFPLADATGHRYNETAADTNIRRPPDGNVNSNATLAAQIAYEVPTSQHTFTLTFAYGLENGSNASVSWRITI